MAHGTPVVTSAMQVSAEVTTGVPCAMASRTGRPKPSQIEGKVKTRAPAYAQARSVSSRRPRTWVRASGKSPHSGSSPHPAGPTRTRSRSVDEAMAW